MITSPIIKSKNLNLGNTVQTVTAGDGTGLALIAASTSIAVVTCDTKTKIVKLPNAGTFGVGKTLIVKSARGANLGFILKANAVTDTVNGVIFDDLTVPTDGLSIGINRAYYFTAVTATAWEMFSEDVRVIETASVAITATASAGTTEIIPPTAKYCKCTSANDAHVIVLPDPLTFGVGCEVVCALNGGGSDAVYTPTAGCTINSAATLTVGQGNVTTFTCTGTTTWQAKTQVGLLA